MFNRCTYNYTRVNNHSAAYYHSADYYGYYYSANYYRIDNICNYNT